MTAVCIVAEVLALLGFAVAAVVYPLRLLRPDVDLTRWGRWGLIGGAVLQGLGLLGHFSRGGETELFGRYANVSFFFVLCILAATWLLQKRTHRPALSAFVAPIIFLLVLFTVFSPNAELPALPHPWLIWHIILALLAYASFGVAFCMAMAYVVGDWSLKHKRLERIRLLPPLTVADNVGHLAIAIGFLLLTLALGIALFTLLALDRPVDFKVVLSTVIWLIYGGYLYVRNVPRWRGRRLQLVIVAGFVLVLVNFLVTRHRGAVLPINPAAVAQAE